MKQKTQTRQSGSANEFLEVIQPVQHVDLERYIEQSKFPQAAMFAVCLNEDDTYIGNARLSNIDWVNRCASYCRMFGHSSGRGQGFGAEALVLLLRYGFHHLGLNRIFSAAIGENSKSLRSNDRVGMKREGVRQQASFKNGRFRDTIALSMLREDFDRLHGSPEDWTAREAEYAERYAGC